MMSYCASQSATQGGEVDRTVSSMDGMTAIPRENGELVFDAPWQSRAFGMAVSLSKSGHFTWDTFRRHLGDAITERGSNGLNGYYHRWLDALERSLADTRLADHDELHQREQEYRERLRDEVF